MKGFTDSDMLVDADTSQSTFGYVITYVGRATSWQSRLQKVVALLTIEVEYMATVEANKEIIWMNELLGELERK